MVTFVKGNWVVMRHKCSFRNDGWLRIHDPLQMFLQRNIASTNHCSTQNMLNMIGNNYNHCDWYWVSVYNEKDKASLETTAVGPEETEQNLKSDGCRHPLIVLSPNEAESYSDPRHDPQQIPWLLWTELLVNLPGRTVLRIKVINYLE